MATDYDHVTTGTLEPIKDHILVTDIEEEDEKTTKSGIIIPTERGSERGIHPRWAKVHAIGPEQKDVSPGQWILISHGRWTRGIKLDDGKVYRKVDPNDILIMTNDSPTS